MTARERVIAALDHRRPDRLPRYEIFFASFIERWKKDKCLPPDADVNEAYRIDIPTVGANQAGPFWREARTDDQGGPACLIRDSWGRLRRQRRDTGFFEVLESAIREKTDVDRLAWPDLDDLVRSVMTPRAVSQVHDPRFAPVTGVMGLYLAGSWIRGETEFMMDLAEDEPFCRVLIEKLCRFLTELGLRMLEATGTWDTAIWVYDDFSINTGPLISPTVFEKLFLPAYRAMFAEWKAKGARHIVLHHDVICEKSYPIIDRFADAGLDGVQGVYPTTGLTVTAFKQRYGKRLSVVGGMCNTHTLPFGSRAEIERQAAMVADAGRDGGVIIGSHSIEEYIPVEHYDWYHAILDKIEEQW